MKKQLLAVFTFVATALSAQNPIPNYGFESWTGTTLNNWYALSVAGCTKSSQPHSGSFALKMAPWGGASYGANAFTPSNGQGFNLNGLNPTSFIGWYMGNFVNGDQLEVIVQVYSGGTATGSGIAFITANASSYTQFTITVVNSGSTADSARIQFTEITSSFSSSGVNAATYVILDDLQFIGTVGIQPYSNTTFGLNAFPNPVNGNSVTLSTAKKMSDQTSISLKTIHGREVIKNNAAQFFQNDGYKINTENLQDGIYFLSVSSDEGTETKKLIVTRSN